MVEARGERQRADLASGDESDEIADHKRDADGEEHLVEVAATEPPEQQRFDREAERSDEQRGEEQPQPELTGALHDGERDVRAEHVEAAVREVDHVHHPEDERQPGGEDEKQGAERDAVQRLLDHDFGTHPGRLVGRDGHVVGLPGSVTRAILSTIVFTAAPPWTFTSRMYMSWIGLCVTLSNSKSPRGLLNLTPSSAAMNASLFAVSPLTACRARSTAVMPSQAWTAKTSGSRLYCF